MGKINVYNNIVMKKKRENMEIEETYT